MKSSPLRHLGLFFVAAAPILLGALIITGGVRWVLGPDVDAVIRIASERMLLPGGPVNYVSSALVSVVARPLCEFLAWSTWTDWRLYVFLFGVASVGSGMHLSSADMRWLPLDGLLLVSAWFVLNVILAGWPELHVRLHAWILGLGGAATAGMGMALAAHIVAIVGVGVPGSAWRHFRRKSLGSSRA